MCGPNVHSCDGLVQGAGLLGDGVGRLVVPETAVSGDPLQDDLAATLRQSFQRPPDADAQRGALCRWAFSQ